MKKVLLLGLLLCGLSWAGESARSSIQAAYNRANEAMKWKYLDGVLSIRTPDYRVAGPDGKPLPAKEDLASLRNALNTSVLINEKTTILKFAQQGRQATTRIHDVITLTVPAPPDHVKPPYVIDSLADDTWGLVDGRWKLKQTRVMAQKQGFLDLGPALTP